MASPTSRRLAIIGAGPIGLSAALMAQSRGFDVTVFEKGLVGDALRRWGATTRLFSPMMMNLPEIARSVLGNALPPDEALLTGPEMVGRVLEPIASSTRLAGRVLTGHRIVSVGRAGLTRTDLPGHPLRAERPFRLLVAAAGGERVVEADAVLDASGVSDNPNRIGPGGMPAVGEMEVASRLIRHLGEMDDHREELTGRTLLIGHGHSAANALLILETIASKHPGMHVTWAVRCAHRRPCTEIADDPLPERGRVVSRANDLAAGPPPFLTVRRRTLLAEVGADGRRFHVRLTGPGPHAAAPETFDQVIAMTGYRPDLSFLSELPIHISPVTEGSAGLARALSDVTDCLTIPTVSPDDLGSGERGFYMAGSRSYGRSPAFLLRTGLAQLEILLDGMER